MTPSCEFSREFPPEKGVLQLMRKGGEVEGAVGLRQRRLRVPLQLHGRVGHDGRRAAEELVRIPEAQTSRG